MKTFKPGELLLAALLFVLAMSCEKAEVIPSILPGALSADVQKSALNGATTYNYQNDIDLTDPKWYEINSCTGEHLRITSGMWHFVMHGMSSDHAFLMSVHNNIQNYKLVSLETGAEYTGNSEWNGHYSFALSNSYSFTATIINTVVLTTPGGGNNSKFIAYFHVTVNPNNVVTVSIDNFRAGCQ